MAHSKFSLLIRVFLSWILILGKFSEAIEILTPSVLDLKKFEKSKELTVKLELNAQDMAEVRSMPQDASLFYYLVTFQPTGQWGVILSRHVVAERLQEGLNTIEKVHWGYVGGRVQLLLVQRAPDTSQVPPLMFSKVYSQTYRHHLLAESQVFQLPGSAPSTPAEEQKKETCRPFYMLHLIGWTTKDCDEVRDNFCCKLEVIPPNPRRSSKSLSSHIQFTVDRQQFPLGWIHLMNVKHDIAEPKERLPAEIRFRVQTSQKSFVDSGVPRPFQDIAYLKVDLEESCFQGLDFKATRIASDLIPWKKAIVGDNVQLSSKDAKGSLGEFKVHFRLAFKVDDGFIEREISPPTPVTFGEISETCKLHVGSHYQPSEWFKKVNQSPETFTFESDLKRSKSISLTAQAPFTKAREIIVIQTQKEKVRISLKHRWIVVKVLMWNRQSWTEVTQLKYDYGSLKKKDIISVELASLHIAGELIRLQIWSEDMNWKMNPMKTKPLISFGPYYVDY